MKGIYQHCGEQHLHRYQRSSISAITTELSLGLMTLMLALP